MSCYKTIINFGEGSFFHKIFFLGFKISPFSFKSWYDKTKIKRDQPFLIGEGFLVLTFFSSVTNRFFLNEQMTCNNKKIVWYFSSRMLMVRQEKKYFGRSTINKNVVFLYVQSLKYLPLDLQYNKLRQMTLTTFGLKNYQTNTYSNNRVQYKSFVFSYFIF